MPCNSDYLAADMREILMSRVACLLDSLTKKPPANHWDGYHPRIYSRGLTSPETDAMVAELCSRLQSDDPATLSPEAQMWWRDHQEADRARLKRETDATKTEKDREASYAKLTPYQRKLLGI